MKSNSIITVFNSRYLWGGFLLVSSIRQRGITLPVKILANDLNDEQRSYLEQFDDVEVLRLKKDGLVNHNNEKPYALSLLDTDILTYLDADGYVVGDITDLLYIEGDGMMARSRNSEEEFHVWSRNYRAGDEKGVIPKRVLDIWRENVNDLDTPKIQVTVTACAYVFQKHHKPFLKLMMEHNERIMGDSLNMYWLDNEAYPLTDESVLNSLLAFSSKAPSEVVDWKLDRYWDKHYAHFQGAAKPWVRWSKKHFKYFDMVMDTLDWVEKNNYKMMERPYSLRRSSKIMMFILAVLEDVYVQTRWRISRIYRIFKEKYTCMKEKFT